MLYSGTFSCGHEGKVNIIGKAKDREWKIERAFSNMCPDCYKKWLEEEHQRKNKEAMEEAKEMDLPELTGTEKQIAWANTLRKKFIDTVEDRIESLKTKNAPKKTKRYQETLDHILLTKTEAKYYIDKIEKNKDKEDKLYSWITKKDWRKRKYSLKIKNKDKEDLYENL